MKFYEFSKKYQEKFKENNIDPFDENFGLCFCLTKLKRIIEKEKLGKEILDQDDEYKNLIKTQEEYKAQFDLLKNKVVIDWLYGDEKDEYYEQIIANCSGKIEDREGDYESLTEDSIDKMIEVSKYYKMITELADKISSFLCETAIINLYEFVKYYYDNDKPFGVLTKSGVLTIEKLKSTGDVKTKEYIYRLHNEQEGKKIGALTIFTKKLDIPQYKYTYIEDFSEIKLNSSNSLPQYCFPKFLLAIISGVSGIYEPLSDYMAKNKIDYITDVADIQRFLETEVPRIIAKICIDNKLKIENIDNPEGELADNKEIVNIINCFINGFIVDDIVPKMSIKFRISNKDLKNNNKDLLDKNSEFCSKITNLVLPPSKVRNITTHENSYCLFCANNDGNKSYTSIPSWAYRNIDNIVKSGGLRWDAVPIGKDIKTDHTVKLNFTTNSGWMVNLIAGSGSGKGVTTMAIVGAAVANRYPIIYLDCKPDMANTIDNAGGLSLDGNTSRHFIKGSDFTNMVEKFKKTYNVQCVNGVAESDVESLCRTIIWCRAVEIFLHLIHIRSQYNGSNEKLKKFKSEKKIHPILVMDEFEAESHIIESVLSKEESSSIMEDGSGNAREISAVKCKLFDMLNRNSYNTNLLINWVKGIFGANDEGICGQTKTAFGRQAGCLIFTISQDIPMGQAGSSKYGKLFDTMLKDYLNTGFITIYGKGTDTGGTKYSLRQLMSEGGLDSPLTMGQFGIRSDGAYQNGVPVKTFLTVDDAYDKDGIITGKAAGVFKGIDPQIRKSIADLVVENATVDPNTGIVCDTKVIEKRIDTNAYIWSLMHDGQEIPDNVDISKDLKENYQYSITYFDEFCQALYGCSLKERLTTIEKEDFFNHMGCTVANNIDKEAYNKLEILKKYAKAYYSYINSEEISKILKETETSDLTAEEEGESNGK